MAPSVDRAGCEWRWERLKKTSAIKNCPKIILETKNKNLMNIPKKRHGCIIPNQKSLYHGGDVIKYHLVPIGDQSEENLKKRNKDYRFYREHNTT